MKRMIFGVFMLLSLAFSACGGGEDEPEQRTVVEIDDGIIWTDAPKCFVQEYIEVTGLSAEPRSGCARVGCLGRTVEAHLVRSQFDCSYEGQYINPSTNFAVLDDFRTIALVSDSDFDDQHKAGTSLADIVMFAGASPYDFIACGYRDACNWDDVDIEFYKRGVYAYEYGYAPVYRRLSEMDAADYRLIHPGFCLVYLEQPTLSKTHNLTLTVTDNKGKAFTVTWRQAFGE